MLRAIGDDEMPDYTGKRVVVIGGGNVAMDVARSSVRLGADKVSIVYRRRKADMTALSEEVEGAEAEGCDVLELMSPVRIEKDENDAAVGLWVQPQMISRIKGGRPSPKTAAKDEVLIPCDLIVVAIGQGIETRYFEEHGVTVKRGTIEALDTSEIKEHKGVFAGGDCVTGPATVIRAIAAGKVAAANIDEYLGYHHEITSDVEILTWGRVSDEYRTNYLNFESVKESYEDEDGFQWGSGASEETAATKAKWRKAIFDNFGRTNSLTFTHVYDNRDNYFNASKGRRLSFSAQWGGHGLGGNYDFYKFTTEGRFYKGLGNGHILALRVMAGYIDGNVSYGNLFDLGGSNTLRGYEDDQFKGSKMYAATLEYRFPIAKKVQGVVFTDMGSTWGIDEGKIPWYKDDNSLNFSVGVGLRLQTPIGPIRLDYGHGDRNKFHFSFGTQF